MKLLIIIPAYNEAENIETVVDHLIEHYPQYDYVIVNDVVDVAVHHMEAILEAERCRTARSTYLLEATEEIGR